MIEPAHVFSALVDRGVGFYAGVPDSLLKGFCAYVTDHAPQGAHIITANEGAAVGLAAGCHLAFGDLALVYMQNSGLGNVVNPILLLADLKVTAGPARLKVEVRRGSRKDLGRPTSTPLQNKKAFVRMLRPTN